MKLKMSLFGLSALLMLTAGSTLCAAPVSGSFNVYQSAGQITPDPLADAMVKAHADYLKNATAGIPLTQGEWYISKLYENTDFGTQNDPEKKAVDLNDGQWKKADYADGRVHPLRMSNRSAFYFTRTLQVANDMKLKIGLGSDDGIMVFLDGTKIMENNASRAAQENSDFATLDLKVGKKHCLMLKIQNGGGDAGFFYNPIFTYPTQKAWDTLCQAYPEKTAMLNGLDKTFGPRWLMSDNLPQTEKEFVMQHLAFVKDLPVGKEILNASPNAPEKRMTALFDALKLKKDIDFCKTQIQLVTVDGLLKAIDDLKTNHPGALENADQIRSEVNAFNGKIDNIADRLMKNDLSIFAEANKICDLQRKIVFAAPAVKAVNDVLVVKRSTRGGSGLPANWQGNTSVGKFYDNELGILNFKTDAYKTIFKPENRGFVGDLDLHFDADKFLFSSISEKGRWQIFEMNTDGSNRRQVTPDAFDDVDNYEAMYLPDERIIYTSSATFLGVPCVAGSDYVGNIHIMNKDGTGIRRLCFDQDNNWCPVLLEDGRVLYLRWEYTDSAHYFSRVLMHMNPDGTAQNEFYGSNSYWPNSLFYARPLPGSTTQFVGVVSGHHGVARIGELYIFDITKGREEDQGVVQQLKAHYSPSSQGKVMDQLVDGAWPKFIYPHPLSNKQFLVSAQPKSSLPWGLYVIDIYNNMTLVSEDPGMFIFEPTPIQTAKRPPIIPDKVDLKNQNATFFIQDVYEGTGLRGVPRGTVKALRIFQYEYSYRNMGGHYAIGMESGWDVRRVIGTVPVFEDGSTTFIAPANTPIAIQPLDAEGKALQQMRSWTVGMPGENVQCVGCHERQNQTVRAKKTVASTHAPMVPEPFYGEKRGFGYDGEIQPILNRYCIQCHDGKNPKLANFADTRIDPNALDKPWSFTGYSYSYWALQPFVRRNGPEGNYRILIPGEFHPNTSELVQLLRKGHYGVRLDSESWDKLNTWIDLNVPFYGNWADQGIPRDFEARRKEMRQLYSNVYEDIEKKVKGAPYDETPVIAKGEKRPAKLSLNAKNWPFTAAQAEKLQKEAGTDRMSVTLADGQKMTFVRIPAGEFNMGSETGMMDELPVNTVKIEKPFWMSEKEVTLGQYKTFDPSHTNYIYDQHYKDQVRPGYDMDRTPDRKEFQPNNPAIRVNWSEAMAFCQWLSEKSGKKVTLPTESQWEWACRGGSDKPMWFGEKDVDFGKFENLADVSLKKMAVMGIDPQPIHNPNKYYDFLPKIATVNDGWLHLSPVGTYQANPFGLFDMHGNAAEWCRDNYRAYPYKMVDADGVTTDPSTVKSVRGGSWYDRPHRATSSFRQDYPAWQKVYNVGFRPIIEE